MDDGPAADPDTADGADAEEAPPSGADAEVAAGAGDEVAADADAAATGADGDASAGSGGPPAGLVTVRGAIYGVALLWLAAMAGFGALQAAIYGATTATPYLLLAVAAAALSVTAGYASLRAFGLK